MRVYEMRIYKTWRKSTTPCFLVLLGENTLTLAPNMCVGQYKTSSCSHNDLQCPMRKVDRIPLEKIPLLHGLLIWKTCQQFLEKNLFASSRFWLAASLISFNIWNKLYIHLWYDQWLTIWLYFVVFSSHLRHLQQDLAQHLQLVSQMHHQYLTCYVKLIRQKLTPSAKYELLISTIILLTSWDIKTSTALPKFFSIQIISRPAGFFISGLCCKGCDPVFPEILPEVVFLDHRVKAIRFDSNLITSI